MIFFTVPGNPVTKERPRVVNGHAFTPTRTRKAEARIRYYAHLAKVSPLEGPVVLVVKFYRANAVRCDLDNLLKLVQDALNGVAYQDDTQIDAIRAMKTVDRSNPRTEIQIWPYQVVTQNETRELPFFGTKKGKSVQKTIGNTST